MTISLRDAANTVIDLRPRLRDRDGVDEVHRQPAGDGIDYPVRVDNVRLIETAAARQYKGSLIIDDLEVEVPSEIATPPPTRRSRDRLIDADGAFDADWCSPPSPTCSSRPPPRI